jgi:hypothetical protein
MNKRLLTIAPFGVLVNMASVLAQDEFPFSGEWTLNRQASTESITS